MFPKYKKYLEETHQKEVEKYKVIADKGLDVERYLTLRHYAIIIAGMGDLIHRINGNGHRYEKCGLLIESFNDLKVVFNKKIVLDKTNYIPGKWEEILEELYKNKDVLWQQKRRKQTTISNVKSLASKLSYDDQLYINENLKIIKSYYHDSKDEYISYGIVVMQNDEVLFSKFRYGYEYECSLREETKYNPGDWEEKIDEYIKGIQELEKKNSNAIAEKQLQKV